MNQQVEAAFTEMLDISSDIDKAVLFGPGELLASNMPPGTQPAAVGHAEELSRLGGLRATEMGSQPLTQLVLETPAGLVFLARETVTDGMTVLATGRKGSRVGLVLYDLKTCLRDAREAMVAEAPGDQGEGEA
jgi:hypothetical protein